MKPSGANYTPKSNALTTAISTILPRNPARKGLILFNVGAADCTFSLGLGDIKIPAGDHVAFLHYPPTNEIYATCATTTTLITWEA